MAPTSDSSILRGKPIKFIYSYGGKIVPRPTDGVLRYVGGYTRVLSVDRSVTFSELMVKFGESCGSSVDLKCKLPNEDLDVLISIKSDEELRNVIEEYDRASPGSKIRAVLFPIKSAKKMSPPSSPISCFDFPSATKLQRKTTPVAMGYYAVPPCAAPSKYRAPTVGYPVSAVNHFCCEGVSRRFLYQEAHRNSSLFC